MVPSPQPIRGVQFITIDCIYHVEINEAVGYIRWLPDKLIVIGQNKVAQAPRFHKYLSWNNRDKSVRTCTVDGDKVYHNISIAISSHIWQISSVNEDMHDGEVTCAVLTDDGRWLVTGGSDTV